MHKVRTQLTNFHAKILADIVEDDGTDTHTRFFDIEATQGAISGRRRLPAKDFQNMTWIPDVPNPATTSLPPVGT
jgi:hypothetical protein